MFTGIVEALGEVLALERRGEGVRLRLRVPAEIGDLQQGQSLAVDGVCLTIVEAHAGAVDADLVDETLRRTTLGRLQPGATVNLERPLAADGRFGGHFVQGHVDGVGVITSMDREGEGGQMEVELPAGLPRFVVEKGSLAIDGVSLTVAASNGARAAVVLIPHTLAATGLGGKRVGDAVNIEVDLLAKYTARLLRGPEGPEESEEGR